MYPNQFYSGYGNAFNTFNGYNAYNGMNTLNSMNTMNGMGNFSQAGTSSLLGNAGKIGLFARLKNGINWNTLLNNTSRTLNIVNQAIPIVNQVKPLMSNVRTMFKIADIMKEDTPKGNSSRSNTTSSINRNTIKKEVSYPEDNQPTFFL